MSTATAPIPPRRLPDTASVAEIIEVRLDDGAVIPESFLPPGVMRALNAEVEYLNL